MWFLKILFVYLRERKSIRMQEQGWRRQGGEAGSTVEEGRRGLDRAGGGIMT